MSYIGKNVAPQPQGTYSQSEIDTQMLTKALTDSPVFTGNGITIPVLSSDPSGAVPGQMYYNSTDKAVKNYNGTNWTFMTNNINATGGTVTEVNGYRIHTFTSSGTFTVLSHGTVEYLIVAGGGGGGLPYGGGGGAGGLLVGTITINSGSYGVIVGGGGSGLIPQDYLQNGVSGGNSSIFELTALGGGAGGSWNSPTGTLGQPGGSGGGGGSSNVSTNGEVGGSGTSGQGFPGGSAGQYNIFGGGGGGGAGSAGEKSTNNNISGSGGMGYTSSINGTSITRAGGGAGGIGNSSETFSSGMVYGGAGQGGYSSSGSVIQNGQNAIANTGSGGGGGGGVGKGFSSTGNSGAGGSGIVIIRYPI